MTVKVSYKLRDGAQSEGLTYSVADSRDRALLDEFGVRSSNGGWPGADADQTRSSSPVPQGGEPLSVILLHSGRPDRPRRRPLPTVGPGLDRGRKERRRKQEQGEL